MERLLTTDYTDGTDISDSDEIKRTLDMRMDFLSLISPSRPPGESGSVISVVKISVWYD
jgi:hypothetical protein